MAAPDVDWPRLWLEAIGSALSAVVGLSVGIWRWGRYSALRDMRFTARIEEMKAVIDASQREIQRRIDDEILVRERDFVRKDDFKEFREEYREDMRDVKQSLDAIRSGK